MYKIQRIFGDEKFVTNINGDIEGVFMSIVEYSKLIDFLEDQKLVDFIKESESEPVLSKEEALRYLGSD